MTAMKHLRTAAAGAGTLALLGGALLAGAGAANAATCAAGEHYVDLGTMGGYCAPTASGGGTGGSTGTNFGGGTVVNPVAPPIQGPTLSGVPNYGTIPAPQAPAAPAPVRQLPAAPQAPVYQAPVPVPGTGGYSSQSRAGGYAQQGYTGATVNGQADTGSAPAQGAPEGVTQTGAAPDAVTAPAPAAAQAPAAVQAAQAKAAQEKQAAAVKTAVVKAIMVMQVKDAVAQAWASR